MDQPLYDHELDAVPLPPEVGPPDGQPAGAFEAWVAGLSMPALAGCGLVAGLAVATPFLLISSQARGTGALLLAVLVLGSLLFVGLRGKLARLRETKGKKGLPAWRFVAPPRRVVTRSWRLFLAWAYALSIMAVIFGLDAAFMFCLDGRQASVRWIYIMAPMASAALSLATLRAISDRDKALAFGVMAAFWLSTLQSLIAFIGTAFVAKLGLIDANLASNVAAGSLLMTIPMAFIANNYVEWATRTLNEPSPPGSDADPSQPPRP